VKRAYHSVLLADGTSVEGPVVVETDAEGKLIGWHKLEEEEASTEWLGGTYCLGKD